MTSCPFLYIYIFFLACLIVSTSHFPDLNVAFNAFHDDLDVGPVSQEKR